MQSGDALWDDSVVGDMVTLPHRGRLCRTFPGLPANLHVSLRRRVAEGRVGVAVVDDFGGTATHAELLAGSERLAAALARRHGVGKGSRVGLLLYNSLELCLAFLALQRLGAVAVPLPTKYKRRELASLIELAGLPLLLCEDALESEVAGTTPAPAIIACRRERGGDGFDRLIDSGDRAANCYEPSLDDDCLLLFTSGTTSAAKGVVLSNLNVMHAAVCYQRLFAVTDADSAVLATPMYNVTGMVAHLALFAHAGGTLHLHRRFKAEQVLAAVRDHGVSLIHASPTVFVKLLERRDDFPALPSLRLLACGSANMPAECIRRLKAWLPGTAFRTIYGMTENSSPACVFPGDAAASPFIGASGWPVPGMEAMVADEDGRELPDGEVGELWLRGTSIMEEYLGRPGEGFAPGRWLRTGDLARVDAAGYVYITDRKKDMINRAGEKVWSLEVENLLHECPGVAEAAVAGIPDPVYGEAVAALLRRRDGTALDAGRVREFMAGKLAKYKLPAVIAFVDELPKTPNGKIDKAAVRRTAMEHNETSAPVIRNSTSP